MEVRLPRDAARMAAARAGLAAARDARAARPGPGAESLRSAYLDVLKLCLCDLAGPSTMSVSADANGTVSSRELRGYDMRLRGAGMDWPLHGLTMTGLYRLDDLQSCVQSTVRDGVEGDFIEAGAWRGSASILMRATLDALGVEDRTVWLADSFEGFPGAGDEDADEVDRIYSGFDFLAVPVEEVRDNLARLGCERGMRLVPGFFKDTLPTLADGRWAIARLDGDSYDATQIALRSLYPGLSVGGYLIVDDYGAFADCREAVDEFRREHAITEPLEAVDWTCVRWRRSSDVAIKGLAAPAAAAEENGAVRRKRDVRPRASSVPTMRELARARELAELRERLAGAEAAAHRRQDTKASPVRALTAWLRARGERGHMRRFRR